MTYIDPDPDDNEGPLSAVKLEKQILSVRATFEVFQKIFYGSAMGLLLASSWAFASLHNLEIARISSSDHIDTLQKDLADAKAFMAARSYEPKEMQDLRADLESLNKTVVSHQPIFDRVTKMEVQVDLLLKHVDAIQFQLDHERVVK